MKIYDNVMYTYIMWATTKLAGLYTYNQTQVSIKATFIRVSYDAILLRTIVA